MNEHTKERILSKIQLIDSTLRQVHLSKSDKDSVLDMLMELERIITKIKICPECGHVFQGNGWDGIDAHWRSKHDNIMLYKEAWPLIKQGLSPSKTLSG